LAFGGYLVVVEAMLPGVAVAAALLIMRIGSSAEQVMVGSIDLAYARTAWRNIASSDVEQAPTQTAAKSAPEWITLENVTARYGQSKSPALRDAKLAIAPGECIGVIGPRASGKSSLLAVIAGELTPVSGMAAIGNAAISAFQRQGETRAVGYLGDTPFLVAGTVAENISGFAPHSDEQVIAAAVRAGAHDAISALPEGYATEVGHCGNAIPMRARRGIALARALYANPIAVVLDAPEICLDATERSRLVGILDSIRRDGVTMVIATGDPSLLRLTDRIVLMSNGTIEAVLPSGQVTGARHVTARQVA
jgi:ABC-type protease/lipase transport system fused ATPase/permease subunit